MLVSDNDLIYDTVLHAGERRRSRMSAYYICCVCDNQYIYGVPQKARMCPVCMHTMHLVSVVDEFELSRMDSWSGGILRAKELIGDRLADLRHYFFDRDDVSRSVKLQALGLLDRKELC